ncbi:MAG: SNF2-related protein [Acidobacteriota bacterium]
MSLLTDHAWKLKYTPDDGNLVKVFYVPALETAARYWRSTGYFGATALALAARGIEGVVRNNGHMRLVVGCTLDPPEIEAIERGLKLREAVEQHIGAFPLVPGDETETSALELLAWMVAKGILEVKVAIPCNKHRKPVSANGIFHEKAGIIEDKAGNRIAWNGSLNETKSGWMYNSESFHVFTSWGAEAGHVIAEEEDFARVWADKSPRVITLDVPTAVREELLRFLPNDDRPARLQEIDEPERDHPTTPKSPNDSGQALPPTASEVRRLVWGFIRHAPQFPNGGDRVGEATSAVSPWPHQARAFRRMYDSWPPRLLIADEVGLGKTIQAGMLLRQAWLAGRAKRVLILAPKAVLPQWQNELREKFNLNWPIYDGQKLRWYPSRALQGAHERSVSATEWHKQPFVIVSSQLMRRQSRADELVAAEPWDIVVLDEAHHARRRGGGIGSDTRPNRLLQLMRRLNERTQGLILLTATPMQVTPLEVWDLLSLLGLPPEWDQNSFLRFFDDVVSPNPATATLDMLAYLFRAVESAYGQVPLQEALRMCSGSQIQAKRILRALREHSNVPRAQLGASDRQVALRLMRSNTPIRKLISRHTRDLLRKYYKEGKLSTPIADRSVRDIFVPLTERERGLYEDVEDYISRCYNAADQRDRTAVGFVMTIYRRRLASSFYALLQTLSAHLASIQAGHAERTANALDEDTYDDELEDELLDSDEAAKLEREALQNEEITTIESLVRQASALPPDSKVQTLVSVLRELFDAGYTRVMVFTQYTDTLDFLREHLSKQTPYRLLCFSGRGGEVMAGQGYWTRVSRDDARRRFRDGQAEVMLCTDAAAEGLNFQFCGALVNYDMPWNPMRVEQRIGRIDRLGQQHSEIRIINLHYEDTVESDIYRVLRTRINLFEAVVGGLQPILSQLSGRIKDTVLHGSDRSAVLGKLEQAVNAPRSGLDLDEMADSELDLHEQGRSPYTMEDLDRVLVSDGVLPPGIQVKGMGIGEYSYSWPGMKEPIRATTDSDYYAENPESVELWSPGSPVFPTPTDVAEDIQALAGSSINELLNAGLSVAEAQAPS